MGHLTRRSRALVPIAGGLTAAALFAAWFVTGVHNEFISAIGLPAIVLFVTAVFVLWMERGRAQKREGKLIEMGADLRHKEAELERLASTDTLTGLLNRRVFYDQLTAEFRRSTRYGRPISVILLDLDHFKQVNDTHGHAAGDFVLAEFADILRESLREVDMCGRYGGEEFVVMLPETDGNQATVVAERVRLAVKERIFSTGQASLRMTVSQGIATAPSDAIKSEDDIVSAADTALYEAKRAGRDRWRVFGAAVAAEAERTG